VITKGMKVGIAIMLLGIIIGIIGTIIGAVSGMLGMYQRDTTFTMNAIMWLLYAVGGIITIGSPLIALLRSNNA